MASPIEPQDLVIHVLNVGFGDNILIEFPADSAGQRFYGLVDCRSTSKTSRYLDKLVQLRPGRTQLAFLCATHPHQDHVGGIQPLLTDEKYRPQEFWDSGFRHNSQTYLRILETLWQEGIRMVRVSAGMEWYFGKVQVTALAPSIALRNKYATYGIDMNNASIVLRLEHHTEDLLLIRSREYTGNVSVEMLRDAGRSVAILSGDAEFASWAQIANDFPRLERTSAHDPLVKKMVNYLACSLVKVAHHGSMHSTPLDVYEVMAPELAIVSTEQEQSTKHIDGQELTREMFPHKSATIALEESGARIVTTDGSYESGTGNDGMPRDPGLAHAGSVVVVLPPGGKARWTKLLDGHSEVPEPPQVV
jgi:beta-lactamase superfamily II metal-dependent hydrolase